MIKNFMLNLPVFLFLHQLSDAQTSLTLLRLLE